MKKLMLIVLCMIMLPKTNAIGQQIKHVVSNGGGIKYGATYTSFSVVGQLAASEFSTGTYSGSIGYLDNSDNNPNAIAQTAKQHGLMTVYPNPSSGDVWVDFNIGNKNKIVLRVMNTMGQNLYQNEYSNTNSHHIVLQKVLFKAPGLYTIVVNHDENIYFQKITITK